MNRLILIRHGQSTGNADHAFYKYPDSAVALTMLGIQQCIDCADRLKTEFPFINYHQHGLTTFVSTYTRAQQTARIVLDRLNLRHIQPTVTRALDERNHGDGVLVDGMYDLPDVAPFDGETMIETRRRIAAWWDRRADYLLTAGDVILFAHAHVLAGLTAHILHLSDDEMMRVSKPNAYPFVYQYEDGAYRYLGTRPIMKAEDEQEVVY